MKPKIKSRIRTHADLARALGVSRQLVSTWNKKPGAPKNLDLQAWQEFLTTSARIQVRFSEQDKIKLGLLKIRILRAQAQKVECANSVLAGELLDKTQTGDLAANAVAAIFATLDERLLRDGPTRLAGLDEKGTYLVMQDVLAGAHDDCRVALAKLGGESVPDYERKLFTQSQVDAELYQKAFRDGCSSTWMQFIEWRTARDAESAVDRRTWCVQRASENLPVPNATPEELAATPGLKKS